MTWGKASRKKPEIRTVTSIRGRPSSASGIGSRPVTRRDCSSQTGVTPSSARTSPMSSPDVRIADVPHIDSPTERGSSPVSSRYRARRESAMAVPVWYASRDGIAFGSTE